MLLAFDIGNSRTKVGIFSKDDLLGVVSFDSSAEQYPKVASQAIELLFANHTLQTADITGIAIASVVPPRTKQSETTSKKLFQKQPLIISTSMESPVTIHYENAAKLGIDRFCNIVAAYQYYGGPLIIVDWGTATKFEIIDRKGNYWGGAIAPGLESSLQTLSERTALLPKVDLAFPPAIIGTGTIECLQSGIMHGITEMTKGMVNRFKKLTGKGTAVIATGGYAPLLRTHVRSIHSTELHLVLEGVHILYDLNKPTEK